MVHGVLGYAHAAFRRARRMNRDLRGLPLTIAICRNESASRSKEMPKNRLIDTAALRRSPVIAAFGQSGDCREW
jgi:hypothetical protein